MNVRIFWVHAMKCMCAQTRPRFILSSERVFGGMEFEPMLTPREKSPLPENVPRGGSNPRRCGQRAQALPTELLRPPSLLLMYWLPIVGCVFLFQSDRDLLYDQLKHELEEKIKRLEEDRHSIDITSGMYIYIWTYDDMFYFLFRLIRDTEKDWLDVKMLHNTQILQQQFSSKAHPFFFVIVYVVCQMDTPVSTINCLVGLVVKVLIWEWKIWGSNPPCNRIFSGRVIQVT